MRLDNIDWYSVYKKWTLNAGVFEYLFKSSPFVTAKYIEGFDFDVKSEFKLQGEIEKALAENIEDSRIIILDVDTILGIEAAVILNNKLHAAPILSYNFLFHPYGVVGDRKLMEDLYSASQVIKPINPRTYSFILDYNRYKEDTDLQNPMIFNNQYEITDEEMPDVDTLKVLGIKSAAYFYKYNIKEDISTYLDYLMEKGIIVDITKLD
jgi:hypothetical protein